MTNLERAREIMDTNFIGTEEVQRHFGVAYAEDELRELAGIPFGEETLRAHRNTHVLFAGAPLSLNDIRSLADRHLLGEGHWYRHEAFASERKVGVRWHLLRREPVPKSARKTYDEQAAHLGPLEGVPSACEVAYMAILYCRTYGRRLLPDVYVRCRDNVSAGVGRIVVGRFDPGWFAVSCWLDHDSHDDLGLASSVRPRKS